MGRGEQRVDPAGTAERHLWQSDLAPADLRRQAVDITVHTDDHIGDREPNDVARRVVETSSPRTAVLRGNGGKRTGDAVHLPRVAGCRLLS
jgi:hypothetical protein